MTQKLTGEVLIEKIKDLVNQENDIPKSKLAACCGYTLENGMPDFLAFHNALCAATGKDPSEERKSDISAEKQKQIEAEIKSELRDYAKRSFEEQSEQGHGDIRAEEGESHPIKSALIRDGYSEDDINIMRDAAGGFYNLQRMALWAAAHYGEEEADKLFPSGPGDRKGIKDDFERLFRAWLHANKRIFEVEKQKSFVWTSRLNSTVCNLWRRAHVVQHAFELCEKKT